MTSRPCRTMTCAPSCTGAAVSGATASWMPSSTCALRRTPATLPANVRTVTCWPSRSSRTVFSIVAKAVVATVRVAMTTANKARARGERRTLLRTARDGQLPRTSTLCARNLSDKRHLLRGRGRWDGWDDAALMSDLLHPRRCGIRRPPERRLLPAEDSGRSRRHRRGHLIRALAANLCERADGQRHEVGSVRTAAVRHRRQEGRVGLHEQQLRRCYGSGCAQVILVLECHVAGERH